MAPWLAGAMPRCLLGLAGDALERAAEERRRVDAPRREVLEVCPQVACQLGRAAGNRGCRDHGRSLATTAGWEYLGGIASSHRGGGMLI